MTTGFETQQTTFGTIFKAAPKPQIIGSKLQQTPAPDKGVTLEPRSFVERPSAPVPTQLNT